MARAHDRPKRLLSSFLANRLVIGAPSFPPTSKHSGAHIVPTIVKSRASIKARDRKNRTARPSRKGRDNPFPVTVGAFVGACCLPIQGWCRHDESHFLRALGTKQCPGVSKDCLVRHILVHRHDEFPSRREKRREC